MACVLVPQCIDFGLTEYCCSHGKAKSGIPYDESESSPDAVASPLMLGWIRAPNGGHQSGDPA